MSAPASKRRWLLDALVFGCFAAAALVAKSGAQALLLAVVAGAGLAFARGPISRVAAIVAFLVAWFFSPRAGAGLLGGLWLARSVVDRGRRVPEGEAVTAPPAAPAPAPDPPAATIETPAPSPEAVLEQLVRESGDDWPRAALDHSDPQVRRHAVRTLRERARETSAELLAQRLAVDDNDDVMIDAVGALRALGGPVAVTALTDLVTTRDYLWPPIYEKALRALAELGDARVIPQLVESLARRSSPHEEIQAGLPAFGEASRPALEDGLRHPKAAVRARCALALGRLGDQRSAPAIAPLLDAREPTVRAAAAAALGELRAERLAAELLARLDEPAWEVRAAAARALGLLGWREAVPGLAARTGDAHDEVARAAAESLELLRDPAAVPALVELLKNEWLRVEAGAALHATGPGASAALLRPLLASPDAPLVLAVQELLAESGDQAAALALTPPAQLEDPEPRRVREAARALGRAGTEGARALADALPRLDWGSCRICVDELVALGDAAVPLLSDVAQRDEPLLRFWAAAGLVRIDTPAARAAIEAMSKHETDARVCELL